MSAAAFDDDWEEYSPESGLSLHHHMLAGSMAGLSEHVVMYPVDTVKTHMQALRSAEPVSALTQYSRLVDGAGILRLWRGVQTMLVGCLPAHAVYFSIYETIKHNSSSHPAGLALAGAASVCAHDMIMTPMDVVKQRLQLGYYTGMWDCVRSVARTEGLGAFYRSYMTTLTMNVPLHGVLVPLNEAIKYAVGPRETYAGQLALSLGAGLIAGGVAAFVTTPLDVAKTRLQTQAIVAAAEAAAGAGAVGAVSAPVSGPVSSLSSGSSASSRHAYMGKLGGGGVADAGSSSISKMSPAGVASLSSLAQRRGAASVAQTPGQIQGKSPQYTGLVSALKGIFREEGWTGLMRGARPRVLVNAPSAAISWTTYEIGKSILLAYKN